ncbi:hypothetical protein ACFYXM_22775 [Streptomyces sp. NPDC002476]|uniref:hypothetical protein n=1 Tax=Streptomyces sp. NPDC002476 TaxID=3364648 RepID=UPI00367A6F63
MSNTPRTQKPTAPKAGSRSSIRVDATLSDDLAVIMATGADFAGAVRATVGQLADMYRTAWAHGTVPESETPLLIAYQLAPRPTPTHQP